MIPLIPLTGVSVKLTPLQVVVVMVFTDAAGLIVTMAVNVVPVQLPETGVTT